MRALRPGVVFALLTVVGLSLVVHFARRGKARAAVAGAEASSA